MWPASEIEPPEQSPNIWSWQLVVVEVPKVRASYALFPASAGTHQVSVVSWDSSTTATCHDLTARQGMASVTITAGEEAFAFVYGVSKTDLHLVIAPIAP